MNQGKITIKFKDASFVERDSLELYDALKRVI